MDEHREAPRHRVHKAGTIEFGGGAINCTVRNMSNTGAALDVTRPVGIPRALYLSPANRRSAYVLPRRMAQGKADRYSFRPTARALRPIAHVTDYLTAIVGADPRHLRSISWKPPLMYLNPYSFQSVFS